MTQLIAQHWRASVALYHYLHTGYCNTTDWSVCTSCDPDRNVYDVSEGHVDTLSPHHVPGSELIQIMQGTLVRDEEQGSRSAPFTKESCFRGK